MKFVKKDRRVINTPDSTGAVSSKIDATAPTQLPTEISEDTVIKSYLGVLQDYGIDETHIMKVLDSLLTEGEVRWTFDILGKIPCMFVTRKGFAVDFLLEQLDEEDPKMLSRYQAIIAQVNIAASLTRFKDQTFSVDTKESVQANLKWLATQPFIIVDNLTKQLALFDRVIAVATSDWGVKNFTKPLSES